MTKNIVSNLSFAFVAFLFSALMMTSCSDNESSSLDAETTEDFVNQSVYSLQTEGNVGKMGCFEFVFPISIEYPDGTSVSVDDYDSLRDNIKSWIEDNAEELDLPERDSSRRHRHGYLANISWDLLPTLSFPLDVLSADGELSTIESRADLLELKRSCRKDFYGNRGHHGHHKGDKCFSLVFPVTVILEDGSTISGDDRDELRAQIKEWKEANPDATERPTLQFPVTVELEDGSTQEITDATGLEDLKGSCSAE